MESTDLSCNVATLSSCRWKKSTKHMVFVGIGLFIDVTLLVVFSSQIATKVGPVSMYIALVVITGCVFSVLFFLMRKAYLLKVQEDVASAVQAMELEEGSEEFLKTLSGLPTRFRYQELETATTGFSKMLGRGGFGSVYEGKLPDGSQVAVKRLEREGGGGQKEFCAEVATISRIYHINLVSLKGFCVEGTKRLLVYEFMPKGSLDKWLFRDRDKEKTAANPLDWETRFRIALETARGLAYLHEECQERILHLDVKPQNILLDDGFHAKVSDFGLSRSMDRDQSRLVTTMRGTPGYLAPEWLLGSGIDSKTDVYSYGMVLLELVSGRRCLDQSQEDSENWYLPTIAFKKVRENRAMEIVDPLVALRQGEVKVETKWERQAETAIRVALWCIQENAATRPVMGNVVQMLEGNQEVKEPPASSTEVAGGRPFLSITVQSESLTLPR